MQCGKILLLALICTAAGTRAAGCRYRLALGVRVGNAVSVEAAIDQSSGASKASEMRNREEHFTAILTEYGPALDRLAAAYEKNADLRNDLLQEIRLALWRALPFFRNRSSERTFIYRVAHNRALTWVARRHPDQLEIDVALEIPDAAPGPEHLLLASRRQQELQDRVAALPLTLRQVASLALEGLSNSEIGEVVGISDGNVAVRLSRAKKQMKGGPGR